MKTAKEIIGAPQTKVAVLRIDHRVWAGMPPQQQLLFAMQQALGFMASEFFSDFEGLAVHVIDPAFAKPQQVVLQIGKEPATSSLIIPAAN
jgi:hypothetical protein